jgi:hypothetical protein
MRQKIMKKSIEECNDLEKELKVAKARASRLEEEIESIPSHIRGDRSNTIIHEMLRADDAERLAEQEKTAAEKANSRYFDVLDRQWEVFGYIPQELWVQLQPYITLPKEDSGLESFHVRKGNFTEY